MYMQAILVVEDLATHRDALAVWGAFLGRLPCQIASF
jgi:hypothetical protein